MSKIDKRYSTPNVKISGFWKFEWTHFLIVITTESLDIYSHHTESVLFSKLRSTAPRTSLEVCWSVELAVTVQQQLQVYCRDQHVSNIMVSASKVSYTSIWAHLSWLMTQAET